MKVKIFSVNMKSNTMNMIFLAISLLYFLLKNKLILTKIVHEVIKLESICVLDCCTHVRHARAVNTTTL